MKTNKARIWEGVPGVAYPQDKLLGEAPKGYIPTAEAAELLGCTPAAARQLLARRGVRRVLVAGSGRGHAYYARSAVMHVVGDMPIFEEPPDGLAPTSLAVTVSGLARSSLGRYEARGALHVVRRRVRGRSGVRIMCYYDFDELRRVRRMVTERLIDRLNMMDRRWRDDT